MLSLHDSHETTARLSNSALFHGPGPFEEFGWLRDLRPTQEAVELLTIEHLLFEQVQ
jgi:hypothetical protein